MNKPCVVRRASQRFPANQNLSTPRWLVGDVVFVKPAMQCVARIAENLAPGERYGHAYNPAG
jgi:hypothetical protein